MMHTAVEFVEKMHADYLAFERCKKALAKTLETKLNAKSADFQCFYRVGSHHIEIQKVDERLGYGTGDTVSLRMNDNTFECAIFHKFGTALGKTKFGTFKRNLRKFALTAGYTKENIHIVEFP